MDIKDIYLTEGWSAENLPITAGKSDKIYLNIMDIDHLSKYSAHKEVKWAEIQHKISRGTVPNLRDLTWLQLEEARGHIRLNYSV